MAEGILSNRLIADSANQCAHFLTLIVLHSLFTICQLCPLFAALKFLKKTAVLALASEGYAICKHEGHWYILNAAEHAALL